MTQLLHRPLLIAIAGAVAVALAGGAAPAFADTGSPTTYHVDCSATTSGDGVTAPWRTLGAVTAHGPFTPGDQILIKRGTSCTGRIDPLGSGSKGAPITIGAYGSGKAPVLNGKGTPSGTGVITLTNVQYWTVRDLKITNNTSWSTKGYRSGVLFFNTGVGRLKGLTATHLQIEDVVSNPASGAQGPRAFGGISALTLGHAKDGYDDLLIADNTLNRIGRTGIVVLNNEYPKGYDRNVRISSNTVSHARGDSILLLGSRGSRIDGNVSAAGADFWPCPQCKGISPETANAGIWAIRSDTVRIDHNEVYGEHVLGGDGEGFDIDSSANNVVMEDNYAHDNQGGGVLLCGSKSATVRFNIFQNNKKSAIAFIGTYPAKKSAIYNNTIYNSAKSGARPVRYFNGKRGSGITFKNNLVYNYGPSSWLWPTKPKTSANTLVGSNGVGRPADSKTSYVNPGLKKPGSGKVGMKSLKGYKPKHPSSFKRGVAIPSSVKVDFFGKKINAKKPPRGAAG
jgi:parallel beta-helix repeat protein